MHVFYRYVTLLRVQHAHLPKKTEKYCILYINICFDTIMINSGQQENNKGKWAEEATQFHFTSFK